MKHFSIPRHETFSLAAAAEFYSGFVPGSGMARAQGPNLTLAFRLDDTFDPVVVSLREESDHVVGDVVGTDDTLAASQQVARMLGLDVDGDAWRAVGERDPVVGRLMAAFPGFFTAAKHSPYDAAAWGIIVARTSMANAARVKTGLAEKHGDRVTLGGVTHALFPSPRQLLGVGAFPGLSEEKLKRLEGLALAALEGRLSVARLRAMSERDALASLEALRGIGPWTAGHVLYRGAALHDGLPTTEPRVLAGLAEAYGLSSPTIADLERIAEPWRPFRMWVSILLVRHLARVGGFHRAELTRERSRLGRARLADARASRA